MGQLWEKKEISLQLIIVGDQRLQDQCWEGYTPIEKTFNRWEKGLRKKNFYGRDWDKPIKIVGIVGKF